jgi:tRNA pseudouridine55 synthase
MDGILLVDKQATWSSRDVVNKTMSTFHIKKVGHTGTLDPFATGLMIVTIGKGTKTGPFIEALEKTYVATIKLGEKTATGDTEREVSETAPIPPLTKEQVEEVLKTFLGEISQIPPQASAIKVDGVPSYKRERAGEDFELEPRLITIYSMKLIELALPLLTFEVRASKGTYVRTLAEDIAKKLGTLGHLISLRRTKIGKFDVKNAADILAIKEEKILPISTALAYLSKVVVKDEDVKAVKDGKTFRFGGNKIVLVVDKSGEPLAVYERQDDGTYTSLRGLF